jgi:APA family basic amino acid/polyamine antiporter
MLYALSLGRRRFSTISTVHARFHTPWVAIVIHTAVAIPLALGGSFAKLAMLSAVARMTTYLVTSAAVPRLRSRSKGFRTPGLIVPVLGTLIALTLFLTLHLGHLIAAIIAMTVGAALWGLGDSTTADVDRSLSLEEN